MKTRFCRGTALIAALILLAAAAPQARAMIPGIMGPAFNLSARDGHISTPDPSSIYFWGYGDAAGDDIPLYPGPVLLVNQGDSVTVNLTNYLTVPVSIIFPGQENVQAAGGTAGILTQEAAANGGTVTYSFTANNPGTFIYQSGTNPALQIEMGLVGALIVRPAMMMHAYDSMDSMFDREMLFIFTEMDGRIHELMDAGRGAEWDNTTWYPNYWFINGRCAPDTMVAMGADAFPNQPLGAMPMMHPGEKFLMRIISAGRDYHPFHTHGNNFDIIARDGQLCSTGMDADLSESNFTVTVDPGGTLDAIWSWTGANLGWDIYGHAPDVDNDPQGNFPGPEDVDYNKNGTLDPMPGLEQFEDENNHGKPFPVVLPEKKDMTFGAAYSGSPFLGSMDALPPGQGIGNLAGGYFYMWHSHKEKEMTTNNIFPGGLMTMPVIVPWSVDLDDMEM